MKPKGTFRILHESIQKRPDLAADPAALKDGENAPCVARISCGGHMAHP